MAVTAAQLIAEVSVSGAGSAQAQLSAVGSTVENTSGLLKTALVGAAVAGGVALVGIGVQSVKMAGDFQSSMTQLVTGAGESQKNLKMVSDGILQLATDTGTSTKDLAAGMYNIESAGYHGAKGLDVLKASAEGAKVGGASLADVSNGVTTAMTDYSKSGLTAAQATNTLIATVASGKTHMADLANAMSTILPTGAAVGVSFTDVSAAMATMTGEGTDAASAATYLRQLLMALESPGTQAANTLKEIGLSTQQVSDGMKKSLPGTLQMITDALAKKFPVGSAAYVSAIKDIAGGSKQMQGMLELTGDHIKVFQGNVEGIAGAVKKGGNSIVGWTQVQGDFNTVMDRAKATLETVGIKIGTALLPSVGQLLDKVGPVVTAFGNWLLSGNRLQNGITAVTGAVTQAVGVISGIINWYQQWNGVVNTTAVAITVLFVPAMIKSGVEAVAAGIKIGVTYVGNIVKAGIAGWEAAGKLAIFIGQMVATGVQAVAAGAKVVASFVASLVTTSAQAIATGAVIAARFVVSLVAAGAQAVLTGATMLASLIPALTSMIAEATIAAVTAIPGLVIGFGAWAAGAIAAAIPTLALTWPILAVAAAVVAVILIFKNWGAISKWVGGVFDWLGTHVREVATNIKNGVGGAFDSMGTNVRNKTTELGTNVLNQWNKLNHSSDSSWQDIANTAGKRAGQMRDAVVGYVQQLGSQLGANFSRIATQAVVWGANFISGLISGIESMAGNMENVIGGMFSNLGSDVHNALHNAGIPGFASGTSSAPGGISWVGERGPELMYIPRGAQIIPSNQTGSATAGGQQQIIVQSPPIYLDGRLLTSGMMPYLANAIRYSVGSVGF